MFWIPTHGLNIPKNYTSTYSFLYHYKVTTVIAWVRSNVSSRGDEKNSNNIYFLFLLLLLLLLFLSFFSSFSSSFFFFFFFFFYCPSVRCRVTVSPIFLQNSLFLTTSFQLRFWSKSIPSLQTVFSHLPVGFSTGLLPLEHPPIIFVGDEGHDNHPSLLCDQPTVISGTENIRSATLSRNLYVYPLYNSLHLLTWVGTIIYLRIFKRYWHGLKSWSFSLQPVIFHWVRKKPAHKTKAHLSTTRHLCEGGYLIPAKFLWVS